MSWTKRDIVTHALDDIGIVSSEAEVDADMMAVALARLDAMAASWYAKGIRIGYPLSGSHALATADAPLNIPDSAFEPLYMNLSARLAPGFGKTLSPFQILIAREGYRTLMARASMPAEMSLGGSVPSGAGRKWNRYITLPTDLDSLGVGPDGSFSF
jgi:hypothetical protein